MSFNTQKTESAVWSGSPPELESGFKVSGIPIPDSETSWIGSHEKNHFWMLLVGISYLNFLPEWLRRT